MKNSVLPVVRAAVAALPVKFNTMDLYAALPATKKTSVNTALEILLKRGDITARPLESVQFTVNSGAVCGQRRSVNVRAWSRAAAMDATDDGPKAFRPSYAIPWTQGANRLVDAMSAWPASAAVSVYE